MAARRKNDGGGGGGVGDVSNVHLEKGLEGESFSNLRRQPSRLDIIDGMSDEQIRNLEGFPDFGPDVDYSGYSFPVGDSAKVDAVVEFAQQVLQDQGIVSSMQLAAVMRKHNNLFLLESERKRKTGVDGELLLHFDTSKMMLLVLCVQSEKFIEFCWKPNCKMYSSTLFMTCADHAAEEIDKQQQTSNDCNKRETTSGVGEGGGAKRTLADELKRSGLNAIPIAGTGVLTACYIADTIRILTEEALKGIYYANGVLSETFGKTFSVRENMTMPILGYFKRVLTTNQHTTSAITVCFHRLEGRFYVKINRPRGREPVGWIPICRKACSKGHYCFQIVESKYVDFCKFHATIDDLKDGVLRVLAQCAKVSSPTELTQELLCVVKQKLKTYENWTLTLSETVRISVTPSTNELRFILRGNTFQLCENLDGGCLRIRHSASVRHCPCNRMTLYDAVFVYIKPTKEFPTGVYLSLITSSSGNCISTAIRQIVRLRTDTFFKPLVNLSSDEYIALHTVSHLSDREEAVAYTTGWLLCLKIEAWIKGRDVTILNSSPYINKNSSRYFRWELKDRCGLDLCIVHGDSGRDKTYTSGINQTPPADLSGDMPRVYTARNPVSREVYIGKAEMRGVYRRPDDGQAADYHRFPKYDSSNFRLFKTNDVFESAAAFIIDHTERGVKAIETLFIVAHFLISSLLIDPNAEFTVLNAQLSSMKLGSRWFDELNEILYHQFGMTIIIRDNGKRVGRHYPGYECKFLREEPLLPTASTTTTTTGGDDDEKVGG